MSFAKRLSAILLGVGFVIGTAVVDVAHTCPQHGAAHAASSHQHHGSHSSGSHAPGNHCTCVGQCCPPSIARVAAAGIVVLSPPVLRVRLALDPAPAAPTHVRVARVQLTTGPPTVVDRTS